MSFVSEEIDQSVDLGTTSLSRELLASAVYSSLVRRYKELITPEDISAVLETLNLEEFLLEFQSSKLHIKHLRFEGVKHLHDREDSIPFVYDQQFAPGVNVLLIEDNEVGKSSIWKTIKFALTGDNDDYDADVRSWITNIWLVFALNERSYTTILSYHDESMHALLVPGEEFRPFEEAAVTTSILFKAVGTENIKAELQHFFFHHLGLTQLAWTQALPGNEGEVAERKTSWRTYFQALLIPDGGDRYLLCDPQHAYGNQAGLILSTFLGLSFTDPLNKLSVEASRIRKAVKYEQSLSEEEIRLAEEKIAELNLELIAVRNRYKEIIADQKARRNAVEDAESNRQLLDMQGLFREKNAELAAVQAKIEEIGKDIQRDRGREQHLREAIALQLHFTGIHVTLCPNCDIAIDEDAITQERETHTCRLCGKPAHAAPPEELTMMKAEADACETHRKATENDREALRRQNTHLRSQLSTLSDDIKRTQAAAAKGLLFAFPTPEEEVEQEQLLTKIGMLQRDLTIAGERTKGRQSKIDHLDLHQKVVDKVREVLKKEAEQRNSEKLKRLSRLTQDIAQRIGAVSVTNVNCTPYGVIQLHKHDKQVAFNGIKNDGERLRVKLAFFLAMMRLSRETSGGRHPGFLIIDQPGSNEMVQTDFDTLAQIFRQIDQEFSPEMQILCFTARPQFKQATDSTRVYGPQAAPFAF
jgi:hypothetical protein